MRIVKFVTMHVEDRRMHPNERVLRYTSINHRGGFLPEEGGQGLAPVGDEFMVATPAELRCEIVPIHQVTKCFNRGALTKHEDIVRKDTFIAYSKEVEDILEVPIALLHERAEASEKSAQRAMHKHNILLGMIGGASLWRRVKYLFSGGVDWLRET